MKRLIWATALTALFASHAAFAADLGGNCCADLEERVAELEATVATKGNRKVSLEVSGQVNKAIIGYDVFGNDDVRVIDNAHSPTQFRFIGRAKVSADLSIGYTLEIGANELAADQLKVRRSSVHVDHKQFGRLTLGQDSYATDGAGQNTLANTAIAAPMLTWEPVTSTSIFDGGRGQLVRYDTASFNGFWASVAWGDDDIWDMALRYYGEIQGFKVKGTIGYRDDQSTPVDMKTVVGSLSVMHVESGIFGNVAYGRVDPTGFDDAKMFQLQAGMEQKISSMGKTTVYLEYGQVDVFGIDPALYGFGVVQSIDAAAMDLYLSYRHIDADFGGEDKADIVMVGARVKF